MTASLTGSAAEIDLAGVAYVLGSLFFAIGYGVLAISYTRRHGLRKSAVVVGVLGAPALLALLLLVIPGVLVATELMPPPD